MIAELQADLQRRCDEEGLGMAALMLTDITTSTTRLLYTGDWNHILDTHATDGVLMMENTLSRKKQGWPWLQTVLAK